MKIPRASNLRLSSGLPLLEGHLAKGLILTTPGQMIGM